VRSHRGHRLGLLLKSDMMRWLGEAEPQLRTIDTWNAESNDHMIAINERLGYRVMGRGIAYQRRA
jgi:RimJ/RimL family protein N-acetyltransferase